MELKKIGIQHISKPGAPENDPNFVNRVKVAVPEATVYSGTIEEIAAQTDDLDAIIAASEAFTGFGLEFLMSCRSLKWIQGWFSGVDMIMSSDVVKIKGIRISAVRGPHAPAISDHVIGFIYYYLRNFPALTNARMRKDWETGRAAPLDEALTKTVGLIGLGHIGMEIARKCHGLGFRVLAAKRTPIKCDYVEHCYPIGQLDVFLKECDYVVVACPLTPESSGMIGKNQFRVMKKEAILINIARGAVVDESELIHALDRGEIAGAALDAFCEEPLPPHSPFWEHDKVIISYHQSSSSPLTWGRVYEVILDNLARYQEDRPLLNEEVLF